MVQPAPACVSGTLKTLNPYTSPMHMCTAMAAGGTSQRLNPGLATVASRERNFINQSPWGNAWSQFLCGHRPTSVTWRALRRLGTSWTAPDNTRRSGPAMARQSTRYNVRSQAVCHSRDAARVTRMRATRGSATDRGHRPGTFFPRNAWHKGGKAAGVHALPQAKVAGPLFFLRPDGS